jgi:hypothetical protein
MGAISLPVRAAAEAAFANSSIWSVLQPGMITQSYRAAACLCLPWGFSTVRPYKALISLESSSRRVTEAFNAISTGLQQFCSNETARAQALGQITAAASPLPATKHTERTGARISVWFDCTMQYKVSKTASPRAAVPELDRPPMAQLAGAGKLPKQSQ